MREPLRQALALLGFALVVALAASIGSFATSSSLDGWYGTLEKPSWTPPGSFIGAVWTVLYTGMAVAAWLVWRRGGLAGNRAAFVAFGVQLALNALWSILFFGLRSPGAGVVGIVLLAAAVAWTIALFWRVSRPAALLLVPYLAWVLFAGSLNAIIWRMNA